MKYFKCFSFLVTLVLFSQLLFSAMPGENDWVNDNLGNHELFADLNNGDSLFLLPVLWEDIEADQSGGVVAPDSVQDGNTDENKYPDDDEEDHESEYDVPDDYESFHDDDEDDYESQHDDLGDYRSCDDDEADEQQPIKKQRTTAGIEKKWRCQECDKAFSRKEHLTQHKVTHTKIKAHICTYPGCRKAYTQKGGLTRHIAITHKGERRFACESCDLRFGTHYELECHERKHSGERPFKCTYPGCQEAFTQSIVLTKHEKTHVRTLKRKQSGETPYECPECGIAYTRKDNLKTHMRKKHNL